MKQHVWVLVVSFAAAFFLRWYLIPTHLFFGPEQGRDFWDIQKITTGDLTLIGPKTDFDGVFHGPVSYYIAAVPFALTSGNPLAVAFVFVLIQSATVFLAYRLGKEMSDSTKVAGIAAVLFAVSYGNIVYARWLSQQQFAIPLGFAFLLFLLRFLAGNSNALVVLAGLAGLLGQVQFINYLFVPLFCLYIFIRFRNRFRLVPKKTIMKACAVYAIVGLGTFALFNFLHDNMLVKGMQAALFSESGHAPFAASVSEVSRLLFVWISQFSGIPSVQWAPVVSLVFLGYALARAASGKRIDEVFLVWILLPAAVLILFRRGGLDQLLVAIAPAVVVLTSSIVARFRLRYVILSGLVLVNTNAVFGNFPTNRNVFFQAPQPEVRYSDQLAVVDEVFRRAGNRSFEIQAYTIPFFWQDAWTYLFWHKGQTRYGGKIPVSQKGDVLFVIIQKDRANPIFQNNWYNQTVTGWGRKVEEFTIGEYTVEERVLTK